MTTLHASDLRRPRRSMAVTARVFTLWLGAAATAFAWTASARAESPDEVEPQIIEEASADEGASRSVESFTGSARRPVQVFETEEGVIELTNRSTAGAADGRVRAPKNDTAREPASSLDGTTSSRRQAAGDKALSRHPSSEASASSTSALKAAVIMLGLALGVLWLVLRRRAARRLGRTAPWAAAVDEPGTAPAAALLRSSVPPPASNRQWLSQRPPSDADSAEGSTQSLGQVEHYRPLPR